MRKVTFVILFLFSLVLLSSCQRPAAKHVILLGIDGLSTDGIQVAKTPNLDQLIREGAFSLKARGVMPTVSSPNWGSMLCGAGPEQHGITSNGWLVDNYTIEATAKDSDGYFPSVFTVIRRQMPQAKTAFFYDWAGLGNLYNQKYIDVVELAKDYKDVYQRAIPYIVENKPDFAFVYVGHPDEEGHAHAHGSPEYYKSIEDVDTKVGELIAALKQVGIYEETYIIVISDHGGVGYGHGGESMAEIQVPWIIKGPGVIQNRLIEQPVNTYYTAGTIAYLFGLEQPEAWIGQSVLGAFEWNDESKVNENSYLPKPKSSLKSGIYTEPTELSFTVNADGAQIRYTLKGEYPTLKSPLYENPIALEQSALVKACTFKEGTQSIVSVTEYTRVVGIKNVQIKTAPSPKYPAEEGGLELIDGKRGSTDYLHQAWMGFEEDDLEAIIDFGELKSFNKVSLNCLENKGSWIFLPEEVIFAVSQNGRDYKTIGQLGPKEIASVEGQAIKSIGIHFQNVGTRYLKIWAKNIGRCPADHPGAGGKAWLFVDEILVE